ncbi:hypothetical protein [Nonomuraea sp. GTA35]|uniref:hypothetical protein n=1 Tax=Nonomuraea sp. GTA35 TaxID=1676746 RepID=UPI0035C05C92
MKGRLRTSVYLVALVWPMPGFLASAPSAVTVVLVAAGVAGFVALYLRVVWTALVRPNRNATPYALILLFVVTAAVAPVLGEMWVFTTSYFLIAALATSLPERALPAAAGATIAAVTLALPLLGRPLAEYWWMPLQAVVFTAAIRAYLRLESANRALSEANVEVERLAVDNERLRFARDMHDLLGHSLAVIRRQDDRERHTRFAADLAALAVWSPGGVVTATPEQLAGRLLATSQDIRETIRYGVERGLLGIPEGATFTAVPRPIEAG